MGRKARHTARTGDGGAELRHKQRQVKEVERDHKKSELEFFDEPSENDNDSDELESEGSEFGDEEEVLQLGGDDDDDEEEDEEEDSDDDVDEFGDEDEKKRIMKMDSKWGKSKKTFYSADTAEFELEDDEEIAKDEEDAALELQRKQAAMMDNEDFGLDNSDEEEAGGDDDDDEEEDDAAEPMDDEELLGDQLADISMLTDDSRKTSVEQVKKDFSKMTKKEKLQIVNQTAPELLGLSSELETTMRELNEVVTPAILKLKEVRKRTNEFNTGVQYLVTRQNLMLNYIANISFYLLLRAEGKSVANHPVLQHLLALKGQMNRLGAVDDVVNTQLHDLLTQEFPEDEEEMDDGLDKFISGADKTTKSKKGKGKRIAAAVTDSKASSSKKSSKKQKTTAAEKEEAAAFYEEALREKQALQKAKQQLYTHEKPGLAESDDDEDSGLDEGTKRGASYAIIKNKGLKAHKSKLNRNPRVKKRLQYRKAVIRRKGQVRDVRVGEAGRYGGETTGIKSNLSRSRKIRS